MIKNYKIGNNVIIDKEYYIKKYKEKFGVNVIIDGLTNDNDIKTGFIKSIKNKIKLTITDFSAILYNNETTNFKNETIYYIHFIDEDGLESLVDLNFIQFDV